MQCLSINLCQSLLWCQSKPINARSLFDRNGQTQTNKCICGSDTALVSCTFVAEWSCVMSHDCVMIINFGCPVWLRGAPWRGGLYFPAKYFTLFTRIIYKIRILPHFIIKSPDFLINGHNWTSSSHKWTSSSVSGPCTWTSPQTEWTSSSVSVK